MFERIVGQEAVKRTLAGMLDADRVPHALLFAGPSGVGKRETSVALARALLCGQREACGSCPSCRRVDRGEHPDLHLLFPFRAQPEKADAYAKWADELNERRLRLLTEFYSSLPTDAGREIVTKLVEEARDRLFEHSFEGGRRICIVLQAERLNRPTGNKLLKILEEPPPGVHFILTAERPTAVLSTIRSRCAVVPFRRLTAIEIGTALEEAGVVDPTVRDEAVVLAEGSLAAALACARSGTAESLMQSFDMFAAAATGGEETVIEQTIPFDRSWDFAAAEELIRGFVLFTRLVFEHLAGIGPAAGRFAARTADLALRTDVIRLGRLSERLEEHLDMIGRNVAVTLVLSTILYDIHDTFGSVTEQ